MTAAERRRDWLEWHRPYDEPGSALRRRLATVQGRLAEALDRCPTGPIRLISVCAGQGRDVLEVLPDHPRGTDVVARLVERDGRNVEWARASAGRASLSAVEVVQGDASTSSAYAGVAPADVVLVCGVFGNVSDQDIAGTVRFLPRLCAPGATVIWTRHRNPPDLTPAIRRWFADAGFAELAFDTDADTPFSVGTHRLEGQPLPYQAGVPLFRFRDGL